MKPLFLVGYMAAGKTTLGRRAAQLLNVEFIDLDAYNLDTGNGYPICLPNGEKRVSGI